MNSIFTLISKKIRTSCRAIAVLLVVFFTVIDAQASVVVTIPSTPGTDTSSFTPTNRRYAYSASRMLFTASEVGTTGTVTAIAFQKYSGATSTSINYISIYMKETTATTVTTSLPSTFPTGYKLVYFSSYIDNTMLSGWTTVTLSTALADIFTFSGGSNNLEIVVKKVSSETATTSYPVYNCNTTASTMSAYYYSTSAAMGTTLTTTSLKRPNIKLTFENTCAGKPAAGTVVGPSSAVCSGSTFTLNTTGLTVGTGMFYQWQSRNAGSGAYTNMGVADTFPTLTTSTTVNKDYRIYSVCTLSGQSDTTAGVTVNVVDATTISAASDTTFCIGGSVSLLTSTPAPTGVTYTWFKNGLTTGVTGATYNATTSGIYTLRSSSGSCSGIFSNPITVTVNPLPTATITPLSATTFCNGLDVKLQASTGTSYTYQWQKGGVDIAGETASIYTATTSGTYRVKVTNSATGCFDYSAGTVVTVNPMPTAPVISTTSGASSYCRGDSLTLTAIPTSGYTYQWENSSGPITGATTTTYVAKSPSTYTLKATLGSCTIASNSLVITENPLPTAIIIPSGTVSFCNGDSLKIQASVSTGVSYQWLDAGTPISGAPTTSFIFVKAAGVYSVKVTNTTTGCFDKSATLTVNIITPSTPTISAAGPTTFCLGDSVKLNSVVATGLTTQWQESNSDITGATAASYVVYASGVYRLKVTNGVGCAAYSSPITVKVNPLPSNALSISGGTDICNGSASIITAPIKPGYTYQWRNLGVDIVGATGNPYYAKTAGTYSVHIVDTNGCQSNSSDVVVTVKFVKAFYIHPWGNTFFCDGDSTKLSTQPGFTSYQWFFNGVYIPGATDTFVYANKNGKYAVQVQDPTNGCYATSTGFNIVVIPSPTTPDIIHVGSRLSTSVKGVTYQWYKNGVAIPGATDSFIIISAPAIYTIEVTNVSNCSKTAQINLNGSDINNAVAKTYFIKVYPNPTKDKLNIEAPEGVTVSLKDIQGRTVFEPKEVKQIDMALLASGIYIIQFTDSNNQIIATEKVSKIDY